MEVGKFYDEVYFDRQASGGNIQGELELFKFSSFIKESDRVLDFGCGSGALLRAIGERSGSLVGVEINPSAVRAAKANGIPVVSSITDVDECSIDAVISNHAIEHVENPLEVLRQIERVLKPGGLSVLVVPCDRANFKYRQDDPDFHLYSWSANNFGNLLHAADLEVMSAEEILHCWPPKWQFFLRVLGARGFHSLSRIWARIYRKRSQVRVVGRKRS